MVSDGMTWAAFWQEIPQWSSWIFQHPMALVLVGLAPVLTLIFWVASKGKARLSGQSDWDEAAEMKSMSFRHPLIDRMHWIVQPQAKSSFWRWALQALRWVILALLAIALASPVKEVPLPPEPQTKTVRDLVFVIESSASFLLPDYEMNGQPTTRMAVVKSVLDQFVSGLQGNRFSFIVYAEQAFTLMPLTTDAVTARLMLKRLRPYLAGRTDEGAGEALGLGLQQTENSTKTTQKRVVIFISDGQSRASRIPLEEAITYAQGLNVPIYTIGIGAGSAQADKRAFTGLLYQPLKSGMLKHLAAETGGRYYQVNGEASLQKVLQAIDQTEGAQLETPQKKTAKIELYPYFVALALMVFVFYFALVQLLAKRLQTEEVA